MFFIYQTILSLLIIFSPIIFIFRFFKNKENKRSILEKICFSSKNRGSGKIIWFHGASVGEILSIVPILEKYEKHKSIKKILLTTSTLSSSKVIKKLKFKKITHQFYPLDHALFVKKFLNHWKPNLAIFIESEIWPTMFKEINKKKIPLILLNARITRKTFKRWIKVKEFAQSIFNNILISYPQNQETKLYLKKLGSKKIIKIGNLKFVENKFEKHLYPYDKIQSMANYKKVYWIPELTSKIGFIENYFNDPEKQEEVKKSLQLLQNEITAQNKVYPKLAYEGADRLQIGAVKEQDFQDLKDYLKLQRTFYNKLHNRTLDDRDDAINYLTKDANINFTEAKNNNRNQSLADLVSNKLELSHYIEYNGRLIPQENPIYRDSESFNSHFFAPQKKVFGKKIKTFWVNIVVIWLMTLALVIALFNDFFRKLINLFDR